MIQVELDGNKIEQDLTFIRTLGELVELLKSSISPETMIVSLTYDGNPLTENDWNIPLAAQQNKILQIFTGSKKEYLKDRLETAPTLVEQICLEFSDASASYSKGSSADGSNKLGIAVKDLGAFVGWYNSLLAMDQNLKPCATTFVEKVKELNKVCQQLHQHQMYQSWWLAGETISKSLQPQLQEIKEYCKNTAGAL